MGIGPIYAVPKLLKFHGLKTDDIGRLLPARLFIAETTSRSAQASTTSMAEVSQSTIPMASRDWYEMLCSKAIIAERNMSW